MRGHGIGDVGQVEHLMPLLRFGGDDEGTAAGASGIRKMPPDVSHLRFRNQGASMLHVTRLGAALLLRCGTPEPLFGLAGQPILTRRERGIGGIEAQLFAQVLHQPPQGDDQLIGLVQAAGPLRQGFDQARRIHGDIVRDYF
jgi:hypothetical protein